MTRLIADIPGEERAKVLIGGKAPLGLHAYTTLDPLYTIPAQFTDTINQAKKILYDTIEGPVCPYLNAIITQNCIIINPISVQVGDDLLSLLKPEFDRIIQSLGQYIDSSAFNYYTKEKSLNLFTMMCPVVNPEGLTQDFCEQMTLQYNIQRNNVIHNGHMIADVNPFRENGGGGRTSEEQESQSYFKAEEGGFMFMFKHHDATDDQFMRTPAQLEYHFAKYPKLKDLYNPYRKDSIKNIDTAGIQKHIAEGYEIINSISENSNPIEVVNKLYEKCLFDTSEEEIRGLIACFHRSLDYTKDYLSKKMQEAEKKYTITLQKVFG